MASCNIKRHKTTVQEIVNSWIALHTTLEEIKREVKKDLSKKKKELDFIIISIITFLRSGGLA
jgi:hypothetical protein